MIVSITITTLASLTSLSITLVKFQSCWFFNEKPVVKGRLSKDSCSALFEEQKLYLETDKGWKLFVNAYIEECSWNDDEKKSDESVKMDKNCRND